jgi:hypothetical protein
MSPAEAAAAAITVFLAVVPVAAYLLDGAGLGVTPIPALCIAVAVSVAFAWRLLKIAKPNSTDAIAWAGVVFFMATMLLRMSWPSLVPPGRGPDLTHHLVLVDYIEQTGHLVHDRSLDGVLGEMAHYTPASHLLAVIFGAVFGVDGLRAFFPLTAICAALTAGFVFLIARRIGITLPYAIVAVVMLFLPAQYFFGAFTHDSFLAQSVSTLFAVAAWWALVVWEDFRHPTVSAALAVFSVAMFLSWPIWIGPTLIVFIALALKTSRPQDLPPSPRLRRASKTSRPREQRGRHLAIVILPLLAIFVLHSWDRWGWLMLIRTSGAVLRPSLESLGFQLPVLALAGIVFAAGDRRARVTIVWLFVIVLQAITLYAIAKAQGADTPYMAFKMTYLAIYPMAILAAYALKCAVQSAEFRARRNPPHSALRNPPHSALRTPHFHDPLGWLLAAALLAVVVRPALAAPREIPVIDLDLRAAGQWLRANKAATCTDYLVVDAETAYWLHLAVLGNPRAGERMSEVDRYEPRAAMAPWITAEGRSYALADLGLLPDEVRNRVQILQQFGKAAVIARPDAKMMGCD